MFELGKIYIQLQAPIDALRWYVLAFENIGLCMAPTIKLLPIFCGIDVHLTAPHWWNKLKHLQHLYYNSYQQMPPKQHTALFFETIESFFSNYKLLKKSASCITAALIERLANYPFFLPHEQKCRRLRFQAFELECIKTSMPWLKLAETKQEDAEEQAICAHMAKKPARHS
jgi:hypothetical protein